MNTEKYNIRLSSEERQELEKIVNKNLINWILPRRELFLFVFIKLVFLLKYLLDSTFDIMNIQFQSKLIDKDEIQEMKKQIDSGHCDHLFYMDVVTYFTENMRIKKLQIFLR